MDRSHLDYAIDLLPEHEALRRQMVNFRKGAKVELIEAYDLVHRTLGRARPLQGMADRLWEPSASPLRG